MTTRINLNGTIDQDAFVSVFDHGFLFGDSVYEVVSTWNNRPQFLERHLSRLRGSAQALFMEIPKSDAWFIEEVEKTLRAANNEESYIRIVVSRGPGEIDLDPSSCKTPNVVIYVTPAKVHLPEEYETGMDMVLVSIKRNPKEALNPGIKTGNYLNNVLAKMEANRLGAKEALMANPYGQLTECTTSNLFFVKEDRILTPSLDCGILPGITRNVVIQLARENGILVEEGEWPPEALDNADEIFLTGTLKRVMPITRYNDRKVGTGKPGPITRKIMRLYETFLDQSN